MGKIRIKTLGDEEQEKKQKEKVERKKEAKKVGKFSFEGKTETKAEEVKSEKLSTEVQTEPQKLSVAKSASGGQKKEKFQKKQKASHSTKYLTLTQMVDKKKTYSLSEALEILEKVQRGNFDETVELHINTISTGISGNITLPHGTGKKTRVVIADDNLISEIEKGKIDFDILIATPSMMPKLARVAKVLGPRGLMPNPKNGTISQNPAEVAKKYESGQVNFRTEAKTPIIHLTVGKMSFGAKKLAENVEVAVNAVKKSNILNMTLKSTMSPGIKIKI